jgi:hypothetical protein
MTVKCPRFVPKEKACWSKTRDVDNIHAQWHKWVSPEWSGDAAHLCACQYVETGSGGAPEKQAPLPIQIFSGTREVTIWYNIDSH